MHKLLERQLRRLYGSPDGLPEVLRPLVEMVDASYQDADTDRAFLERTMDTASKELMVRQQQLVVALAKSQEAERQLSHQALHDALTDLPNRVLFLDRVEHALAHHRRGSNRVAVLFIDLDNFKDVNDTYGHAAGDTLLRDVARRLKPLIRASDTCARLGGDEFAIVLEGTASAEAALFVAERVLGALRGTFAIGDAGVFVGASIGVALGEAEDDGAALMRNADLAMYMAKTSGRHRAVLYEPSMHAAVVRRVELEQELHAALERREFVLQYQPIMDLESGMVAGFEALVRWEHPRRGRIPPMEFIPIAEESGLILDLGSWILHEACRACTSWDTGTGGRGVSITVNVSGREIREPAYVDNVRSALRESGLAPHRLILEVTENVLVGNDSTTIDRLRALKALGVLLAIDDFGTGYSSLSYLQQFPVDIIKIDKSFIDHLGVVGSESPLSRAVVSLGGALSIRTVAEGIETEVQYERLRELGCGFGQGYLFAKPLPPVSVPTFIREHAGSAPEGSTLEAGETPLRKAPQIAPARKSDALPSNGKANMLRLVSAS
jgi:diguanylate cyclase (GGDEF)-like protein